MTRGNLRAALGASIYAIAGVSGDRERDIWDAEVAMHVAGYERVDSDARPLGEATTVVWRLAR